LINDHLDYNKLTFTQAHPFPHRIKKNKRELEINNKKRTKEEPEMNTKKKNIPRYQVLTK